MRWWLALIVAIGLWVAGAGVALLGEFAVAAALLGVAGLLAIVMAGVAGGQRRETAGGQRRETVGDQPREAHSDAELPAHEVSDFIDPATGVGTSALLELLWYKHVGRFDRLTEPFTLALLDIRHASERDKDLDPDVVTMIGTQLVAAARVEDQVVRLGPHHFAALLSNADEEGGHAFLERLRTKISARPQEIDDRHIYLRVVGGVAAWRDGMRNLEQLIEAARADIGRFAIELQRQSATWARGSTSRE